MYSWVLLIVFQVKDPIQADIVKVVPTSNNGFSEIVRLHHTKVSSIIKKQRIFSLLQLQ